MLIVSVTALILFEERYKPCQLIEIEKGMNGLLMDKSRVIDVK